MRLFKHALSYERTEKQRQSPDNAVDTPSFTREITDIESSTKPSLPAPRSGRKANTYQLNPLRKMVLLVLGSALIILTATGQETPISLETAKELGRVKSRFLKEAKEVAKASDVVPKANVAFFHESVGPLLKQSCLACHGPQKSKGRLRIDQLNPDLLTGPDVERWREVFNALSKSEMPPKDEPDYALADADRGRIVDWLSTELNTASIIRRNSKEHSSFRRLTNYEYNYALQDLLGLPYALPNKLPPETASEDGFKNSSDLLQMSAMQFETYREIGLKAL